MAFVTGAFVIDAPASALNNLGAVEGAMTDNASGVKYIKTKEGLYPYVSAQAYRYWLRRTLEKGSWGWKAAPVYREQKVAYTDANPIEWWDDDLFGYMRAPSKKASAVEAREADPSRAGETPTSETVTRVSPFRVSTLVSLAPASIVNDFGVMARQEGDPVPFEHQFYRATLHALFSLDLHASGLFTYQDKTGYKNLDKERVERAKTKGLEEVTQEKAYRLAREERVKRISALLEAIAYVEGGAKQALHYTDVTPDIVIAAVTRGGNHVFGHVFGVDSLNRPELKLGALKEAFSAFGQDILSTVFVGWVEGYLDEKRASFKTGLQETGELKEWKDRIVLTNPREAMLGVVRELKENPGWLE